jgi:hypothetical protein
LTNPDRNLPWASFRHSAVQHREARGRYPQQFMQPIGERPLNRLNRTLAIRASVAEMGRQGAFDFLDSGQSRPTNLTDLERPQWPNFSRLDYQSMRCFSSVSR